MVLDLKRKLRQAGQGLTMATGLLAAAVGCSTIVPPEKQQANLENRRLDWRENQSRDQSLATVRSQNPDVILPPADLPTVPAGAPAITPVTAKDETASARFQGDAQVRIVATIGTTPIYEREVREAVYQRLPEMMNLTPQERKLKEKAMFNEELRRLIERELILDELFSMLGQKKQAAALNQLKESAVKDAEQRLKDIQKRAGIANDDELRMFLQSQGLTLSGVRRHFERSFMMSAYLGERLKPLLTSISLVNIRDYYEANSQEYMTEDRAKWQDLFVRVDHFRSREDARKYAEWLMNRANHGQDFLKLIDEFDKGDSKSRGGLGFGEERSKIMPSELEPMIFALKQGQVSMMEFESGIHIVRIAERTNAGKRPFDESVQNETRKKLQAIMSEREYRKILDTMWRRMQPQILVE